MLRNLIVRILIRWAANSFGLWIAGQLISSVSHNNDIAVLLIAGLVLSIINAIIKPIVVIFSLPFIVFSLGLFLIIINGFMVWIMSQLVDQFEVNGFGSAVLVGIIIGLVNYAVSTLLEDGKVLKDE